MARKVRTNPRKAPSQDRSKDTVEALLSATAHILVKEGYDRTSTNRIAQAAGVSIGSLYQYFPSKEAIVAALVESYIQEVKQMVETKLASLAHAPVEVACRELVKTMIATHSVNPKLRKVFIEEIPRVGRLQKLREVERHAAQLIRFFLEGQKSRLRPKNLDLAVSILVRAVEAVTHAAVVDYPEYLESEEFVDEVTSLVTRYLVKD